MILIADLRLKVEDLILDFRFWISGLFIVPLTHQNSIRSELPSALAGGYG